MKKILLVSENTIKDNSVVDLNLTPKFIRPAIIEAQERGLKQVLGKKLYDTICSMVADGTIQLSKNEVYKDILDEAQAYLINETISIICVLVSMKATNMGLVKTKDENTENVGLEELVFMQDYFRNMADGDKKFLQEFLRDIKGELPTGMFKCSDSELNSAYSGNVFLGGIRGRILE